MSLFEFLLFLYVLNLPSTKPFAASHVISSHDNFLLRRRTWRFGVGGAARQTGGCLAFIGWRLWVLAMLRICSSPCHSPSRMRCGWCEEIICRSKNGIFLLTRVFLRSSVSLCGWLYTVLSLPLFHIWRNPIQCIVVHKSSTCRWNEHYSSEVHSLMGNWFSCRFVSVRSWKSLVVLLFAANRIWSE